MVYRARCKGSGHAIVTVSVQIEENVKEADI